MPIEFARISGDKRLTLVIHSGSPEEPTPEQQTYWALSEFNDLKAARNNLQAREGAKQLHDIHSVTAKGQTEGTSQPEIFSRIHEWLKSRQDVQAAVWTGLRSNWPARRKGKQFTCQHAVAYLRELESERDQANAAYDRAREYLRNAPPQIQTPVRKMMQREEGWEDATLPAVLFE